MGPEMVTALSGVGVSVVTAAGSIWVAKAGRRTARQERRDDFSVFTKKLNDQIGKLEEKAEKQEQRITDQDLAIGWLLNRVRSLVSHIRAAGMEPPPAMRPPERIKDYIDHLDM